MRDSIGNKLHEGMAVYWVSKQILAKVAKVNETGLSVVGNGKAATVPPSITLEILVGAPPQQGKGAAEMVMVCGDLISVVDPSTSARVEEIVGGVAGRV